MYEDLEGVYDRIVEYAMDIFGKEVKAGTCDECVKYLVLATISEMLEIVVTKKQEIKEKQGVKNV